VGGYLSINCSAKLDAPALESVGGNLSINSSAKLDALKSVGGHLSINSSAKLDAPALESVGGHLSINCSAKLDAPALESVGGYLYINSSAKLDALKSVGGYLSINCSAKLDALKSVGGYLYINSSAKLDALKSVGGYLSINCSAKLDALKSVGGHLSINCSAKLDAPALESVGGHLFIYSEGSLIAGKLYTGGYSNFKVFDNIGCVVLSEKQKGDVKILSCRHSKIKNQKVIGEKFYVAQKNGQNAHAKTVGAALQEIQFKTGNRDITQFKNMPANTKKAPNEWAFVYRMVTGACQYGIQKFIESKGKLKKIYTLKEIVQITEGQWGHDTFVKTINAA
jgi:hypothetical protein